MAQPVFKEKIERGDFLKGKRIKRNTRVCTLPKMSRFEFLQLGNKASIRTFDKEIYHLVEGLKVIHVKTKKIKNLEEIYREIRTVRDLKGKLLAKRKHLKLDLYRIVS